MPCCLTLGTATTECGYLSVREACLLTKLTFKKENESKAVVHWGPYLKETKLGLQGTKIQLRWNMERISLQSKLISTYDKKTTNSVILHTLIQLWGRCDSMSISKVTLNKWKSLTSGLFRFLQSTHTSISSSSDQQNYIFSSIVSESMLSKCGKAKGN